MNAADVLAEGGLYECVLCSEPLADHSKAELAGCYVAALLAHGEQGVGVTIEADGELHPKDPPPSLTKDERAKVEAMRGHTSWTGVPPLLAIIDRLVPLSAEAGDTTDD
jgi:hypothetical protein